MGWEGGARKVVFQIIQKADTILDSLGRGDIFSAAAVQEFRDFFQSKGGPVPTRIILDGGGKLLIRDTRGGALGNIRSIDSSQRAIKIKFQKLLKAVVDPAGLLQIRYLALIENIWSQGHIILEKLRDPGR